MNWIDCGSKNKDELKKAGDEWIVLRKLDKSNIRKIIGWSDFIETWYEKKNGKDMSKLKR